jgi:ABC-type glycerol-3-phosphate transport system permease component
MLFPRKCVLDNHDTYCLIPTQDPVKRNADVRRDAEQVRHTNVKISLTISLILASPNWLGNSVTVVLRSLIIAALLCSLAAYSYQ